MLHRLPVTTLTSRLKSAQTDFWTLDVSQTASYEIFLICLFVFPSVYPSLHLSILPVVCPSVHLSVRPSITNFSQDWIITFSDIVHDDSWPWYLVVDKARFLKRKTGQNWAKRAKSGPKLVWFFLSFSQVWFIIFPWNCIQW